jgi:hypothetical protein
VLFGRRPRQITGLEARQLLYILGSDKLVRELVLADTAPFVPLVMKKRGKGLAGWLHRGLRWHW